jgi:ATP/maltotriose-dependent transcriptional regulator MalT
LLAMVDEYQDRRQQTPWAAAICYTLLARILLEKGETEAAIYWGRRGLTLSERRPGSEADALSLEYLALALVFQGEVAQGEALFQRSERAARQVSPWWQQMSITLALDSYLDAEALESPRVQAQLRMAQDHQAEIPLQTQARILFREQRPQETLALATATLAKLNGQPSSITVRLLIQRALAFQALGDEKSALAALKTALEQAAPEARVFPFVREGEPVETLLRQALKKSIAPEFTRKLLTVFDARRQPQPVHSAEALIEPLSERELEILALLNGPLSTPEIAERLVVSANTVRTHVKNIYGKLGAHGRSGAVRRAQELGLLV